MNIMNDDLYVRAMRADTLRELQSIHEEANRLIGNRAPADHLDILVYGYTQGRIDEKIKSIS